MDDTAYHRRRAEQHRQMMVAGDPQYRSIHRRMMELHEGRAALHNQNVGESLDAVPGS